MGIFVTTRSAATRHAVYAEERQPPATIQAIGTGTAGLVGQFPWGPVNSVVEPTDPADRALTLAPPGMVRTGSAWLATLHKGWPDLRFARVLGSAAAAAGVNLTQSATAICTVPALFLGTSGNLINCIVTNADDLNSNHFNLEVNVTGASGTTSDIFKNLDYSDTATDSTPILVGPRLAGGITKLASGRPDNGTYAMIGGLDGTIDSTRYIGTPGAGDFGMALFENDNDVRTIFSDDPGNTNRVAINAALEAHAILKGDRIAVLNGNSTLSIASCVTAAGSNRSTRVAWSDSWVYIFDDTDGTERLVPSNSFLASIIAQTSPSTSPAMKDAVHIQMLAGINRLETPRGEGASTLTAGGVCCLIQEQNGGFTYEAAVLTIAPSDPRRKLITRTRMGDYIATSIVTSIRGSVDAPNVPLNQQDIVHAIQDFMETLKKNVGTDPNNLPHVLDYSIGDLNAANSQSDLDNGDFTVPLSVKTSSQMSRIFISMQFGETVQITIT